jgi:hypothetical protein
MLSDQAAGDSAIATAATKGNVLLSIIFFSQSSVAYDFD